VKNVVCLAIDGLSAGALGCYGNTSLETPSLDRLAADSLVLDQATTACADLMNVYRAFWQSRPGLADDDLSNGGREQTTLAGVLAESGYATCLLTDDDSLATHALAADFAQNIVLPRLAATEAAASLEQTQAARFFAAAVDALGQLKPPYFAWLHWQGMLGAWDAPQSFRERLADEEDPAPPPFVAVPNLMLPADDDPDHLLGIAQAYGGQVMLLDECFGGFYEQFLADPHVHETLFVLCAPRGFPLGEHRAVGLLQNARGEIIGPPYSELVHIPWLLRFGDGHGRLDRSSSLLQPIDLAPTILASLGIDGESLAGEGVNLLASDLSRAGAVRGHANLSTATHVGIRTPQWHYVEPRGAAPSDELAGELYVKPDDLSEVNNVESRCRETVAELKHMLAKCNKL
jgi:arylsulfatase A-like enzyme